MFTGSEIGPYNNLPFTKHYKQYYNLFTETTA